MKPEEIKAIADKLRQAEQLLGEIGETALAGVNANVKKSMISLRQALYDLGEEDA